MIWIEVELKQKERLLLKCFKLRIPIFDTKESDQSLFLKVSLEDYPKIKKFWFVKVKKSDVTGFLKWKQTLFQNRVFIICICLGLFLLFLLSNVMVKVEVIHTKKEIRDLLLVSLKEKGIAKNTWKKSYQEIEQIKKEILDQYPEKLEWIEILVNGMNYVVRVEERKLEDEKEEKTSCHVVAVKDAIVKDMIYSKGEAVVKVNDSVKKGDILIQGIIKKDEEEKGVVCATGDVYGEVWYQVKASVPLHYEEKVETGKKRWNIRFTNSYYDNFLFKSRLTHYEEEKKPFLNLFGNQFSFVIQHETKVLEKSYTEEEAIDYAVQVALEKISSTLEEKEEIILKKVLKKELNNSTMNVEIFVSVKEKISEVQEFVKEEKIEE